MDYKERLNTSQYCAMEQTEGACLVLAGAGSGKTRLVTHKISYLIEECGINPYHILAITFTNKAAREMQDRAEALLQRSVRGLWIGTFHSICVRILRRNVERDFTIYDTQDRKNLIKQVIKDLSLSEEMIKPSSVAAAISDYKNRGLDAVQFAEDAGSDYYRSQLAKVFTEYEKRKAAYHAFDFDDLLSETVRLFRERPDVLRGYADQFQYIFVDEYQDVNDVQYMLIRQLASIHGNITVVGDENQSIYAFRGANVENIRRFESDFPGANVFYLNENYRSTPEILRAANTLIQNNTQKYKRRLEAQCGSGQTVVYAELGTQEEESHFVANQLESFAQEGTPYGEIAVLYRTNAQSRAFEDAFMRSGIAYQLIGGVRFYDRKEVKDALSYLRVFQNPQDAVSFERMVANPKRGIGPKTVEQLLHLQAFSGMDLLSALETLPNAKAAQLGATLRSIGERREDLSLEELVKAILEETGFLPSLRSLKNPEDVSRAENVEELINYVAAYSAGHPDAGLDDLLQEVALLSDIDAHEGEQKVTLMTIHSAKGLEFDVVFVVGLEEGLFPSSLSMESEREIEEERRLCYVAMTRARKALVLTSARSRRVYGQERFCVKSRFVEEVESVIEPLETGGFRRRPQPANHVAKYMGAVGKIPPRTDVGKTPEFSTGDRIRHKIFGPGLVVSVWGDDITICFDEKGVKKLKRSIAPLEVES